MWFEYRITWARGRGLTTYRPPERVERLYHADRADKVWTEEHVAAFMSVAPETLQRALVLALETGQRQGDLLVLPWSAYDGTWITLRQSKTGRKVRGAGHPSPSSRARNYPAYVSPHSHEWPGATLAPQCLPQGVGAREPKAGSSISPFMISEGRPSRGSAECRVYAAGDCDPSPDTACGMSGPSWIATPPAPTRSPWPLSPSSKGADGEHILQNGLQNESGPQLSTGGHARNRTGVHGFAVASPAAFIKHLASNQGEKRLPCINNLSFIFKP